MRKRNAAVSTLAVSALAFAAACTEVAPTEPAVLSTDAPSFFAAPKNPAAFRGGLDAQFARIARDNPGFGGAYYDESGALVVVQTAGARTMSSRLGSDLARIGVDVAAQPVKTAVGQFDFAQLHAVRVQVRQTLGLRGVVYVDTDERANRVRIGVENASARRSVERALGMMGVPSEAVIISDAEPIVPLQATLRDAIRPIPGGVQIWRFIPPGSGSICTLGFNVRAAGNPNVLGLVTNSHCTEQRGTVTGTEWNQKQFAFPLDPVAVEEFDPPFFTNAQNPRCPVGRNCRWADAAGGRYVPSLTPGGVEFGRIARPENSSQHSAGSLVIDPANPRFHIVSEEPYPMGGETVHKVGRTTGWLIGPVIQTCIDTNVSGPGDVTMLCQERVEATPVGGDSGSPVFMRLGTGANPDVSLIGILWGGSSNTYVFSAMDNVRFETAGYPGWITYPGQTPPD
jgi:hypothetical protein